MTKATYKITSNIEEETGQHALDVEQFLRGELSEDMFKARRVPRGIYSQRSSSREDQGKYMVRVRVPGGLLRAWQLRHLSELGRKYAGADFHFTTRQAVQFHGVKLENTYPIMKGLLKAGLTSLGGGGNTVRNITACAHSGIHPGEVFDTLPHALALTDYFLPQQSAYNLPRKFKISFSCCREESAMAQVSDLGFAARMHNGQRGFIVYAGGGLGAISRRGVLFREFIPEEELVPTAAAAFNLFQQHGDRRNRHRARLRFVLEKMGPEQFLAELEAQLEKAKTEIKGPYSALSDSLERLKKPSAAAPDAAALTFQNEKYRQWLQACTFRQKQEGFYCAVLPLKRGDMPVEDLQVLAELCEQHAASHIRIHRRQNVLIPYVPKEQLPSLFAGLEKLSIQNGTSNGEAWMVSCKGADTCRLGICRSQDLNAAISRAVQEAGLPAGLLAGLGLHTSGCPNNCGQHSAADLGFFGAARRQKGQSYPAYNLVARPKTGRGELQLCEEQGIIPARNVPAFLTELLKDYQSSEQAGQPFTVYWENRGHRAALSLLKKYAPVPPYEKAPEYYRDWGAEEDFSLAGRSAGECGAGIIELIAEELKKSEKAFARAEKSLNDPSALSTHLLEAAALAAGALLVTRGMEPGGMDTSFKEFEKHFMDKDLAPEKHRHLLISARSALQGGPSLGQDQVKTVRAFLDQVQNLYDRMDASFNFPVEKKKEQDLSSTESTELDLRGVSCPMNFVRAKIALEQLPVGAVLEVILDEGEPLDNVPGSFIEQGQEILSINPEGSKLYRVAIRRVK